MPQQPSSSKPSVSAEVREKQCEAEAALWGIIQPKPLTPAEVLQALGIPLTLWLSWRIFRRGQAGERKKILRENLVRYIDDCEKQIDHIVKLVATASQGTAPSSAQLGSMQLEVMFGCTLVRNLLNRLTTLSEKSVAFFGQQHSDFYLAVSGTTSSLFGPAGPQINAAAALLGMYTSSDALRRRLDELRTELLSTA